MKKVLFISPPPYMYSFPRFVCLFFLMMSFSYKSQDLQPNDSLTLLKLKVETPKKQPIEGQYIRIVEKETNRSFDVTTDENGLYDILIPAKNVFRVIIENFYGELGEIELDLPDETNLTYDYVLTIEMSNELDISFKTNSYVLEPSSYPYIDLLLNWLNERKQLSVEIRGHTDNVGSESINLTLSKNRAESVRKYLIEKGIDPKRISAKGFGESNPIESNDTEEGRQKNRRTELIVKN
ncbi:MAG: OmpA family protein [Flavobacteriales bacterium]|nr:OmpA family protein [Flavobacteriales bacterium]